MWGIALLGIAGIIAAAGVCCCAAKCTCESTCTDTYSEIHITIDGFTGSAAGFNGTWVVENGFYAAVVDSTKCRYEQYGTDDIVTGGSIVHQFVYDDGFATDIGLTVGARFVNTCTGAIDAEQDGGNCNGTTDVCTGKTPSEVEVFLEVSLIVELETVAGFTYGMFVERWRSESLGQLPAACDEVGDLELSYFASKVTTTGGAKYYTVEADYEDIDIIHLASDGTINGTTPPSDITVSISWA